MQESDATIAIPNSNAQTVTYNILNQVEDASGQVYSFDVNGNLLSDGERVYSWDAENRLISISYPAQPGKQTEFFYDGRGRRVAISNVLAGSGSTSTLYLWCSDRICQSRSSAGVPQRSYFEEGEFVAGSPNQPLFYGIDQLGSVRRVFANSANAPANDYDPFGVPLQTTASLTDFGFAKLFSEQNSGLSLTRYRAYDSAMGRWLSRDPLGEDPSQSGCLYIYANNSPLSHLDPSGAVTLWWPLPIPQPEPIPNFCPIPGILPEVSGPLFNDEYDDYPGNKPPYQGVPNSTVRGGTQSRTYDSDGYPLRDRDTPHPDEKGIGSEDHVHDWNGRSHEDRSPGRAPQDGDPPIQRGANK